MIFNKDVETIQWRKTVFSINDVSKTGYLHTNEVRPFISYGNINLKQIKDLNVSAKTIKLLGKKNKGKAL